MGFLFRIERAAKGDCSGFGANERVTVAGSLILALSDMPLVVLTAVVGRAPGVDGAPTLRRGAVEETPIEEGTDEKDELSDFSKILARRRFWGTGVLRAAVRRRLEAGCGVAKEDDSAGCFRDIELEKSMIVVGDGWRFQPTVAFYFLLFNCIGGCWVVTLPGVNHGTTTSEKAWFVMSSSEWVSVTVRMYVRLRRIEMI